MTDIINVAVLIGSLRADSFSRRISAALLKIAPPTLHFRNVPIGDLPLYNQDLDGHETPPAYRPFRDAIAQCQAVLFVTPEYNRSIPGSLKNAIDVGSRPFGRGVLMGKPAAIISSSPGLLGGICANYALRNTLVPLNMRVLQQPEVAIGQVAGLLDDQGNCMTDVLKDVLISFLSAFEKIAKDHTDH